MALSNGRPQVAQFREASIQNAAELKRGRGIREVPFAAGLRAARVTSRYSLRRCVGAGRCGVWVSGIALMKRVIISKATSGWFMGTMWPESLTRASSSGDADLTRPAGRPSTIQLRGADKRRGSSARVARAGEQTHTTHRGSSFSLSGRETRPCFIFLKSSLFRGKNSLANCKK